MDIRNIISDPVNTSLATLILIAKNSKISLPVRQQAIEIILRRIVAYKEASVSINS